MKYSNVILKASFFIVSFVCNVNLVQAQTPVNEVCKQGNRFNAVLETIAAMQDVIRENLVSRNLVQGGDEAYLYAVIEDNFAKNTLECGAIEKKMEICKSLKTESLRLVQKRINESVQQGKVFDVRMMTDAIQLSLTMASICDAISPQ